MHQKERYIVSSDDEIIEDFDMVLQEKIDKDLLWLKVPQINGSIFLTERNNPHTMDRMTKEEHESSFKRLNSIGLEACDVKKRINKTED